MALGSERLAIGLVFAYAFLFNILILSVFLHRHVLQIDHHYSNFIVTVMTIEKLQKVATTHVDASLKAMWLQWWNSSTDVKIKNQFPSVLPLREKVLNDWLNKASF